MTKSRNGTRFSTAAALCAAAMAIPGIALADKDDNKEPQCSPRTLRGAYLFSATGFTAQNGAMAPKAIVERIDFHGDGTLHVPAATRSINGVIGRSDPGDATYDLPGPGCVGTLTFNQFLHFDIFVSPNGNDLTMIQTDTGNVLQGKVTRLR